ncbi:IS1182 family transposase [Bradyrhizobium sp. AUGA SZCCT0222]|uniref:IS1182 family transposase n=1 Tax=Bradyrhizobium sp. AUGA SZCCT0222 TaxID=2807668 RepID=UPI001BA593B5|nr:IS1182 family transposase [Bradyrhizobium sp. AUGA SZCCT0222]MBR1268571.1 IS1182 family transposase [Bradyrhizobium sp. AUGA SZCCT0222]
MTNRPFKTGESRQQASLLPPRIEDYVGPDNPVRAIEGFVCALDLAKLGFCHADRGAEEAGQPPYDPADLLKLYLYGYINQIRSSRRLEREACRNLELIWLLKSLRPGYRTIANFRKENWQALKAANRKFVLLARELGLVGGAIVAIDGSFFHGDASKASIFTRRRLKEQIAKLDKDIEAYGKSLDDNDAAEAKKPGRNRRNCSGGGRGGDIGAKVAELMAKRSRAAADLARLEESGETQLSKTDPDARLLVKSGQGTAGYNVQAVVDDKHKLIVASEVVNDSSDVGQLHAMAKVTKDALEAKTLQALADEGYYNSSELKACEDDGIVAYVPVPEVRQPKDGRFGLKEFSYDPAANVYRCPAGELLRPIDGRWQNTSGRTEVRYASRPKACRTCSLKERCLSPKALIRTIGRWEYEDVLERYRARMQGADELMRRRSALVEHPFGTIKCRAGYRHFLVRGFNKVRGEWSLMALCYNLSRVINILGIEQFVERIANALSSLPRVPTAFLNLIHAALSRSWASYSQQFAPCRQALPCTS